LIGGGLAIWSFGRDEPVESVPAFSLEPRPGPGLTERPTTPPPAEAPPTGVGVSASVEAPVVATPVEPETVTVRLRGLPSGSKVIYDDAPVSGGLIRGRAGTKALLVVRAEEYQDLREYLTLDADRDYDVGSKLRKSAPSRREPLAKSPEPPARSGGGQKTKSDSRPIEGPRDIIIDPTPLDI
jgi:hypothetical protein